MKDFAYYTIPAPRKSTHRRLLQKYRVFDFGITRKTTHGIIPYLKSTFGGP